MDFVAGASEKHYRIPFEPPLESYREARERVVAMDKTCVEALGRSYVTVNEFVWPKGLYAFQLSVVAVVLLGFCQRWWFDRGEVVEMVLGSGFARFAWGVQPWVFWGLILAHVVELGLFVPGRLRRHSVNVRSEVFWLWVGAMFLGGVFCSARFDALVARKRAAKEKQQH